MMKYLLLLLAPVASAFGIKPSRPVFMWPLKTTFDASSAEIVDMDRAIECAYTFGECSLEEVAYLRDCKFGP